MAVFTQVPQHEIEAFLAARGIDPRSRAVGVPAGSVNTNLAVTEAGPSGRRLFLRVYEEQGPAGAAAEVAMLGRLAAAGVPTPPPLGTIGTLAGKPAVVFPWRDGGMRCQASVTADDVRRVGEALARVHVAGAGEERGEGRFGAPELRLRLDRIEEEAEPELALEAGPLRATLERLTERRAALAPSLPRGLVHGDLFRDNVLFAPDGSIAALLDFESAFTGPFLFDVAVTVLSWCVGDTLDPALARALVGGYTSVRPLAPAERAPEALYVESCFAALRFTVTRITDYAMRPAGGRVMKDWRRFAGRLATLETMGPEGLAAALFAA